MVLNVCRDILLDRHHAEDAFQAVFLILAQKARSIRDPDLLGNWLYGVALRTSRCAKLRLGRIRKHEEPGSMVQASSLAAASSPDQLLLAREQAALLHAEIERLPRPFRLPVVLCYLEGLTVHEAARRLRCSHGTIRSRMARAREKLRRGLIRRGVTLSAATLTTVLAARSSPGAISFGLCEATTGAAVSFAAGSSAAPTSAALAHRMLRSMILHNVRVAALALVFFATAASTVSYLCGASPAGARANGPSALRQVPVAAKPADTSPKPGPGRMFVVGRVVDPQGKTVPGAMVMASARRGSECEPSVAWKEGRR